MAFCGPCQKPFRNHNSLYQHLKSSSQHSWCDRCKKAFNSNTAKQQHIQDSSRHYVCPRHPCCADFESEKELDLHRCVDNNSTGYGVCSNALSIEEISSDHLGLHRSVIAAVFAFAVRRRFQQPTVELIIRHTKTALDSTIVSALLAAAPHLLPADNTPQGVAKRMEREMVWKAEAKSAEDAFLADFKRLGYGYLNEDDQKGLMTLTPDIRFNEPTLVCDHLCWWVEYKNFFGCRANPYVASSNKKQFRRYAMETGPGAVVYKLGFETGYVDIEA